MEKIQLKKVIKYHDLDGAIRSYKYVPVNGLPDTLAELKRTGFLTITDRFTADCVEEDGINDGPVIALYTARISEFPNNGIDESYAIIDYDPLNGEKIEIELVGEEDVSEQIMAIEEQIAKKQKEMSKKTKKIKKELDELQEQLYALLYN